MVLHRSEMAKKKQELIYGTRDVPPSNFMLKISSFSELPEMISNQKKKYYESCCFEAGGYNWRFRLLILRANRVQKKRIISVYLVLDESNVLATGSDVIANFKFFVYDQIRDNYLTVEDASNRYKRFNKRETCQGISNVMTTSTLKCASNGYLLDDSCVLGVEVQVIKKTRTAESLRFIRIPPQDQLIHTWKINNFSNRNVQFCDPRAFTVAGRKWRIEIKTNYINNWLCMKLKLDDTNCRTLAGLIRWLCREQDQRLYAVYSLSLKNQLHGDQDITLRTNEWFNPEPIVTTWSQIIEMTEIHDHSKGFLVDDVLIVEAHIEWMFASKDIIINGMEVGEEEN
ncbi:hypothetical protein POM88_008345 [Heracleum sosnowskyi]|uniref:MATH domain-containing protein n=1 Tax=Heracleum sosnowskyi TaxID=360622 RepID=A0AAD8J680_9APIA|nr:hypothetical protein POM88_008345 [Heracleum sosnowskyi]